LNSILLYYYAANRLTAYSASAFRQSTMGQERKALQRRKQKLFSTKSLQAALAVIFTGLLSLLTIASAQVLAFVFAENIDGTSGNDTLNGTSEADNINGFEGNDLIFGVSGDDTLDGSKGEDEIHGGDGIDQIKDGNGDPIIGDADYANKVYGGSGGDNIDVGIDHIRSDYYYVYGEDGADYIEVISNAFIDGGIDDDTIYCTGFECAINGNEGNDEIHVQLYDVGSHASGGSGNDEVFGSGYSVDGDGGNDYLSLDSAQDLKGGEGDDVLEVLAPSYETRYNGGPGADTFICSPGPGDIVEDYNPGEGDTISANCETV
jgi:Ca2+-binding RTX toxin-like protein